MDDEKIERYLSIIGKQTFVTYYDLLADLDLTDKEVAKAIAKELDCTFNSALTWRVQPARTLIRSGQTQTALMIISRSNRLPAHITQQASNLATEVTNQ